MGQQARAGFSPLKLGCEVRAQSWLHLCSSGERLPVCKVGVPSCFGHIEEMAAAVTCPWFLAPQRCVALSRLRQRCNERSVSTGVAATAATELVAITSALASIGAVNGVAASRWFLRLPAAVPPPTASRLRSVVGKCDGVPVSMVADLSCGSMDRCTARTPTGMRR